MPDVEQLLVNCLDRDPEEWDAAIEATCLEHPEIANELRERFRIVRGFGADATADPAEPEKLGEFRIVERLGSGGMGVVYRAVQESLGREVAIKLIRPEHLMFDNAKARFERGVTAVASLRHPSVVSIYTVGEDQGVPYNAMELLEGRTLSEVIKGLAGRAPQSLTGRDLLQALRGDDAIDAIETAEIPSLFAGSWIDACVEITTQIARALEHAHTNNLLHRDIKPSNVMVTTDGRAVLLDFGLAGLLQEGDQQRLTRTGTALGTTCYMPAEQFESAGRLGPTADVYSLGVTLYELLTLSVPYEGDNVPSTQLAILAGRPHPIRARNRSVPDDLQVVCLKAMARHADDRYPDARSLADDLDRVRQCVPIAARPPSVPRRLLRFAQRRPATTTALVFSFLLLVGGPSTLWWQSRAHAKELEGLVKSERDAKNKLATSLEEERAAKARAAKATADAVQARQHAEENALELNDVVEFLADIFERAAPGESRGEKLSARDLVERAATRLERSLADRPASRARIEMTLATVYGGLGLYDEATKHSRAATEYYEKHPRPHARYLRAESLRVHAVLLGMAKNTAEAKKLCEQALAIAEASYPPDHPQLARYYSELGHILALRGEFDAAERLAHRLSATKPSGQALITLGVLHASIGNAMCSHDRLDKAEEHLQRAVAILVQGDDLLSLRGGRSLQDIGFIRKVQGKHKDGLQYFARAHKVLAKSRGKDDHMTLAAESEWLHARGVAEGQSRAFADRLTAINAKLRADLSLTHPITIRSHAYELRALMRTKRYAEGLALCAEHQLVEHAAKMLSVKQRLLAAILMDKTLCHSMLRQNRPAMEALGRYLKIQSKIVPERDPKLLRFFLGHAAMAFQEREVELARASLRDAIARVAKHPVWIKPPRPGMAKQEVGVAALKSLLHIEQTIGSDSAAGVQKELLARQKLVDANRK